MCDFLSSTAPTDGTYKAYVFNVTQFLRPQQRRNGRKNRGRWERYIFLAMGRFEKLD